MAVLYCPQCGNKILSKSQKCVNCGFPLPVKTKTKPTAAIVAVIIIFSILGVIIASAGIGLIVRNSFTAQNINLQSEEDTSLLEASQKAFDEAQEAENNEDFPLAISKYGEVAETDSCYEIAQRKIPQLQEKYRNKFLTEAENYAKDKKYSQAIDSIDEAVSVFGQSDEFKGLKEKYNNQMAMHYIKVVVTDKISIAENISRGINGNYVYFTFDVTNTGDKPIRSVEGILTVSDASGNELSRISCDFKGKTIGANSTVKFGDMYFECGRFTDEDTEIFITEYSDLKFSYNALNIVFSDVVTINPR